MKSAALTSIALVVLLVFQVSADDDLEFKTMYCELANVTEAELQAYNADPANKPSADSDKPRTKGAKQPKSAGASYKMTASQIIGGTQATQKMFPWQVYLSAKTSSGSTWLCGGSIISTTAVLTAAHCVQGAVSFSVTAGGINRNTAETGEVTKNTNIFIFHSGYNPSTLVNDIAVIRFPSSPWTFNTYINAVRLPKYSQANITFAGKSAVVSGYGKTSNTSPSSNLLNYVSLSVITNSVCASTYGTTTITGSSICTAAGPKSTCSGDSGGPMVLKEADGKYTQIGVVSFGAAASCNNYPNGFARVSSYLSWINTQTGLAIAP